MACDIDDREGESPSPMEPRLGRMLHSSATGRRREQTLPEALGLRQAPHPPDRTAGNATFALLERAVRRPLAPPGSPARTRFPLAALTWQYYGSSLVGGPGFEPGQAEPTVLQGARPPHRWAPFTCENAALR